MLHDICIAQFTDIATANGIYSASVNPFHGSGCSFVDFDGDGFDDITLLEKNMLPHFFKNLNGSFVIADFDFSPPLETFVDGKTILWFDYNNDGLKDMAYSQHYNGVQLYRNEGNGAFTDITEDANLTVTYGRCMGIAAGDYDRNGYLDLFVCKFHNQIIETDLGLSNQLFSNNGDGTFTDVTVSSGIGLTIQPSFTPVFSDFNRDGWQDIYVVNDKILIGNYLYLNDGDGTFTNVSDSSGAGVHLEAMCAAIEDFDNDNDLDIFVSNNYSLNALLVNEGNAQFIDNGISSGLNGYDPDGAFWGAVWIDHDNNSFQDLYICENRITPSTEQDNDLFINDGDGTLSLATENFGLNANNEASYCCALGDINQDGAPDMLVNNRFPHNANVWLNAGSSSHYLTVDLTGTSSNRDGIGTFIDIWCGAEQFTRYTHCGEGFMTQNSGKEFFGLGNHAYIDSLELTWLSGLREKYYRIPANQSLHLVEGQAASAFLNSSGTMDICPGELFTLSVGTWDSYLWSNGSDLPSIQPSISGDYQCLVTDALGNQFFSDTLVYSVFPELQYTQQVSTVSCFGGEDGEVVFEFESDQDVSILFAGQLLTENFVGNLASGVYGYSLEDSNNCWTNGIAHVEHPQPIEVELFTYDVLCHGDNSGSVTAYATGGVGDMYYDWMGVDPYALYAGEYMLVVSDENDCELSANYTVVEPDHLTAELTSTPQTEGNSDGMVSALVSGGIEPYSLLWSNGMEDVIEIGNLISGTYGLTVMDSLGCTFQQEVFVDFIASLHEENESLLILYPNPADTEVMIWDGIIGPKTEIVIFNSLGQEMLKVNSIKNPERISLSDFPSGIYKITVNTTTTNQSANLIVR